MFYMFILVLVVIDILCLIEFMIREFIYFLNEFYIIEKGVFIDELCVIIFVLINMFYFCFCWNVMFLVYERYILVINFFVYIVKYMLKIVVVWVIIIFVMMVIINIVYVIIMINFLRCLDFVMYFEYYGLIIIFIVVLLMFLLIFFYCFKVYKIKNFFNKEGWYLCYSL